MSKMLWRPSEESIKQSNMYRFMQAVNAKHGMNLDGYAALHAWSIAHPAEFWAAVWRDGGVTVAFGVGDAIGDQNGPVVGQQLQPSLELLDLAGRRARNQHLLRDAAQVKYVPERTVCATSARADKVRRPPQK